MSDKLRAAAQAALLALDSDHPDIQLRAAMNLRAALAEPAPVQVNWNKPELNKLRHSDHCRYWDDGEFCTCGSLEYEDINFWKNKVLAQPEQKPVAVQERMHPEIKKMYEDYFDKCFRESSAQQRPWVGLADDEIKEVANSCVWSETYHVDFARAIEAKLREKNT
jgi:hypothetical protein